jgi:crotonobetainyl-CoA:carnitine CoA-transferase CaiB-like acyl-CoA transferase
LDAKTPEGAEILARLFRGADMVSHNLRPAAAGRMGLAFEQLSAIRPGIVVLASSAYGEVGPKAAAPGFDYIMQAFCGHEARAGGTGNPPLWYRSPITDYAMGALGAFGLLAALKLSRETRSSIKVEGNLLNVGIFLLSELVEAPDGSRQGAPINDAEQRGFHPAEQLYRCRDGWVAIAARTEDMARNLVAALKIELGLGPRSRWDDAARTAISTALSGISVSGAIQTLRAAGVWVERCVEDGWSEMLDRADDEESLVTRRPDTRYGMVCSPGPHVLLSMRPNAAQGRGCPRIGEHTCEILAELDFTAQQIADYHDRGIVRSAS